MPRWLKISLKVLGVLAVVFGVIQLIPYGRTHANPPTTKEPPWDSPRTRELAVRACFDCHSNHTRWPWYASVAPMSWVVLYDVNVARSVLNFSEWDREYPLAVYSSQSILTGTMPTAKYKLAHPEANLSSQELDDLTHGFDKTLGTPPERANR